MRHKSVWAIALLAAAIAAGCSRKPSDSAVVTNIKSQMFSDSQLKDASLQVTASKGEVTLSGTVPTDAARLDAYKIAAQTAGVTKVNDHMAVEQAQAAPQETAAALPVPSPAPEPAPVAKPSRERKHSTHAKKARRSVADATPPADQQTDQPDNSPEPAAAPADAPAPPPVATPAPPQPPSLQQIVVPAGTPLSVSMIDSVSAENDEAGEVFHASLENPLRIGEKLVVPKGADIYVRLVSASKAGRFKGKNELTLALVKLEYQGRSYPLVSDTYVDDGSSQGKSTAKKVGGGAALGAIIGAIAGGGKGAAIGAAAGAGGGGIYQGIGKPKDLTIPSETKLDFQLQQPVTISVMPRASAAQ